jgi:hypothetical protein
VIVLCQEYLESLACLAELHAFVKLGAAKGKGVKGLHLLTVFTNISRLECMERTKHHLIESMAAGPSGQASLSAECLAGAAACKLCAVPKAIELVRPRPTTAHCMRHVGPAPGSCAVHMLCCQLPDPPHP